MSFQDTINQFVEDEGCATCDIRPNCDVFKALNILGNMSKLECENAVRDILKRFS